MRHLLLLIAAPLVALPFFTGCVATYHEPGAYGYYSTYPDYGYYYDRYPHYEHGYAFRGYGHEEHHEDRDAEHHDEGRGWANNR